MLKSFGQRNANSPPSLRSLREAISTTGLKAGLHSSWITMCLVGFFTSLEGETAALHSLTDLTATDDAQGGQQRMVLFTQNPHYHRNICPRREKNITIPSWILFESFTQIHPEQNQTERCISSILL